MPDEQVKSEAAPRPNVEQTAGEKIANIVQELKTEVGDKPIPPVITLDKLEAEKPKPKPKKEKNAVAAPSPQEDDEASTEESAPIEVAEDIADDYSEWDSAVETARAIGMPEDDIDGYDSPEELRGAVRLAKKLMDRQHRDKPQNDSTKDDKKDAGKKSRAFNKKLDAELYDKGIADHLDEMNAHFAAQLDEIEARANEAHEKYGKFEQYQQRAEQARQMAEIEDAMNEVPESVKSIIAYGKDDDAINPNQREARERFAEAVDKEISFANAKGRRLPVAQAIQKALRAEFFDEMNRGEVDKLKQRISERGASIIPRGNGKVQNAGRDSDDDRLDEIVSKLRR